MVVLKHIHDRFRAMFTPDDFAQWMALRESLASDLVADMPRPSHCSANNYFAQVIPLLHARGLFQSHHFYCDLLAARPHRAAEIAEIAEMFRQVRSAALARELVRQSAPSTRSRASTQARRVHRLDLLLHQRASLADDDPRRQHYERELARMSHELLADTSPKPTTTATPDRLTGAAPPLYVMATEASATALLRKPTSALTSFIKALLAAFVLTGTVMLAAHAVWHRLAPIERQIHDPPVEPEPSPPILAWQSTPGSADEPTLTREPTLDPTPRRRPRKRARPDASLASAIPRLPSQLAPRIVETNLRDLVLAAHDPNLTLSIVVRPDGTVDRDRLSVSTVFGQMPARLAELRFPPTLAGSGEVVCSTVTELNPRTLRLDSHNLSLRCRTR